MTKICSHSNSVSLRIASQFCRTHLRRQAYQLEKKRRRSVEYFWANRTRRSSTNRKQFWLSRSPEVITNGAVRLKTKFRIFSFPGPYAYLASFWSYGQKTKFQKNESWLLWQLKSRFRSFIYSHSGTGLWKPYEKSVQWKSRQGSQKGLTEIVKK